jgi:hypothetical protein
MTKPAPPATSTSYTKTKQSRASSLLIKTSRVRRYLLDKASKTRHHRFTSVKKKTLTDLESALRRICEQYVQSRPSKGKRL